MLPYYAVTEIHEYHDQESYFLWVFFYTRTYPEYKGCPLGRKPTPSMISDTVPLSQVFNPTEFMNACKLDWDVPRIILIPEHMRYELTDQEWTLHAIQTGSPEADGIMVEAARKGRKPVLVTMHSKEAEASVASVEREKQEILESERYDGYYYSCRRDGGSWCSGYSQNDDQSSCYEYQLQHMDACRSCTSSFKVQI